MSSCARARKCSTGSSVCRRRLAELLVVPVARRQRLLEDRRVRGDADDGVLLDRGGRARRSPASRARASPSRRSRRARSARAVSMWPSSSLSPSTSVQLLDLLQPCQIATFSRRTSRREKRPHELAGERRADDLRAEAEHVHVVVLDALVRGVRVVADRGADPVDLASPRSRRRPPSRTRARRARPGRRGSAVPTSSRLPG